MTRRKTFGFALLCTALGLALTLGMPGAAPAQPKDAEPIKLGMVKAFFNDLSPVIVDIVTQPFPDLMKDTTNLDGTLSVEDDAFSAAAKLDSNKLQFGVFHGHEFAWVQKKYPGLKPIIVAVNPHDDVKAFVVVHKNSPAASIKDLRGKKMDMPSQTRQHCWVYLEQSCSDNAQNNPKAFFSEVVRSDGWLAGLNNVASGKSDAVIVDTIDLEFYKQIKGPVFVKNLRILQQSKAFPAAVIAYKEGAVKEATLNQFRDGLREAHKKAGSDLMKLWNIEAFRTVPDNYTELLARTLKDYPPPAVKVGMR